jgi:L-cysteine:1D-myo-inositol 2-amino-2-deoxy-alpha-D-glucopyranoside ligase
MDSWPAPALPKLPGSGPEIRIFDTARGSVVPVGPLSAGRTARMYVCGITPYDATHLGHAATYLAFDLLGRAWRDTGRTVEYVQNVTDVDDPLLERAARDGRDWQGLALEETARFREDMTELRLLPPAHYVGAVEAIPLVVELIETLRGKGAAYDVDGDVYFAVHADPRFGELAGLPAEELNRLFAERGGDPARAGKKDPLDCLLWQAARPGEPAWDSPFGPGRPGWHVECAAIALAYLGMGFDVQGGGNDLIFPHHEMSAAEAQVATAEAPFAHAYVHAGMVGLDGEKMSKSRGNLVFVSRLRESGVEPMAIRLALLAHHYRQDWTYQPRELVDAEERLARWRAAVSRPDGVPADTLLAEVRGHLADDLDAPAALAAVDRWVGQQLAVGGEDPGAPGLASRLVDALLGVAL